MPNACWQSSSLAMPTFYEAEGYHQHYMEHHPDHPYIVYNDAPKVAHLQEQFPELYVAK